MRINLPWTPALGAGWFSTTPLADGHRRILAWATLMCMAAHAPHAPLWVLAVAFTTAIGAAWLPYQAKAFWQQKQEQIQAIKLLCLLCCLIGVLLQFGNIVGRDPGTSLLLCLGGLKLLECRWVRDLYVGVYLGYMLCLTALFFGQSLLLLLYVGVTVLVMTSVLRHYNNQQPELPWWAAQRAMLGPLLSALPIMVLLFILFPRVPGALWGLPDEGRIGTVGISDTMEPGSISRLVQSDEMAFRVEFRGAPPEPRELYWRGPVMVHTDGRKWSADQHGSWRRLRPEVTGPGIDYVLTQEPSNLRWVYALEMPSTLPRGLNLSGNYEIKANRALGVRTRYQLTAYREHRLADGRLHQQRALQLPERAHPQARQLAARWVQENDDPAFLIQRALDYFRTQGFTYTLTPGLFTGDVIDSLLFDVRRGFCEHYAAAFVVLMRAAGVPARIVTGYQGGELNPVANYLTIRQLDAHAWAEVYLQDQASWVRVDPTSVVVPERLLTGAGTAIAELNALFPSLFSNHPLASRLWNRLSNNWWAMNYRWTQWILSYGRAEQRSLLARFGLKNMDTVTTALLALCGLLFTVALWAAGAILHYRSAEDPAQRAYGIFCARLARLGVCRGHSEAPGAFAKRLLTLQAEGWHWGFDGAIAAITDAYMASRYGSQNEQLARLQKAVARFRPRKPRRGWAQQGREKTAGT